MIRQQDMPWCTADKHLQHASTRFKNAFKQYFPTANLATENANLQTILSGMPDEQLRKFYWKIYFFNAKKLVRIYYFDL